MYMWSNTFNVEILKLLKKMLFKILFFGQNRPKMVKNTPLPQNCILKLLIPTKLDVILFIITSYIRDNNQWKWQMYEQERPKRSRPTFGAKLALEFLPKAQKLDWPTPTPPHPPSSSLVIFVKKIWHSCLLVTNAISPIFWRFGSGSLLTSLKCVIQTHQ